MRKILSLFLAGALAVASVASAIAQVAPGSTTNPRQPVPRVLAWEAVHYVRTTFAFTNCTQVANVCTVKAQNASLPYNALVLRVTYAVYNAFNSTTSDTLSVGITNANANELVAASTIHAAGLASQTVVTTSLNSIGNTTAQTGSNGGFDLFFKWTAGTGNTATTGLMAVVIEYIAPNDGLCTAVPLTATAAGC